MRFHSIHCRKGWLILVCLITFVAFNVPTLAITHQELRQHITDARKQITSARLVFTEELHKYTPPIKNPRLNAPLGFYKAKQHELNRRIVSLNAASGQERIVVEDLRDIDKLLKENELPENYKSDISRTSISIVQENLLMCFYNKYVSQPDLILANYSSGTILEMSHLEAGLIPTDLLTDDWNPVVEESFVGGHEQTIIKLSRKLEDKERRIIIECDPALGYRFTRIRKTLNGKLTTEITADDYRNIDGNIFPFKYTTKWFNGTGKLSAERKCTFEDVKFNIEFSEDEFKIAVPAGTKVYNSVISEYKILSEAGIYSPKDLVNSMSLELAMQEIQDMAKLEDASDTEVFIPDSKVARQQKNPFVFDLKKEKFIKVPIEIDLHVEEMHTHLSKIGEGDIAWDGNLVVLRSGSVRIQKPQDDNGIRILEEPWDTSLELSQQTQLPYDLVVVTKEKIYYLITVNEISLDGIRVVIEKISPDKAERFNYPETTNNQD